MARVVARTRPSGAGGRSSPREGPLAARLRRVGAVRFTLRGPRSRCTRRLWWLACLALLGLGCEHRARCALGEAELVVKEPAARFDDITLVTHGAAAFAAWSTDRGAFLKPLAPRRGPALRVGNACRGGLAAISTPSALWIACSEPPSVALEGAVSLHAFDLRGRRRGEPRTLGSVGRDAQGVALAASDKALFIAYGAGHVSGPRVMLVRVDDLGRGRAGRPRPLSGPDKNGRSPSLLFSHGALWSAWTESDLTPGKNTHRIMIARDGTAPQRLLNVDSDHPDPALASDARGVVLAFRTERGGATRAELFVARIGQDLRFSERPRAIGRANGLRGPRLALCEKTRTATVPIDHASELYVAFHPLSAALRVLEQNHQYYESGHQLVQSAAGCLAGEPLVLMAEQTEPVTPQARLLAARFTCTN